MFLGSPLHNCEVVPKPCPTTRLESWFQISTNPRCALQDSVSRDRPEDRMASVNMHTRQFVFLFDAILATSFAVRAFAQAAEEQAVLAQIQAMFDGMSKRDAAAIKAPALQE